MLKYSYYFCEIVRGLLFFHVISLFYQINMDIVVITQFLTIFILIIIIILFTEKDKNDDDDKKNNNDKKKIKKKNKTCKMR